MAMKKGPTKGSGGKHRNALKGKGPTPKAEDRVYHKAYKAKKAADRRKMADPRLAARRRVAKFTSESDDLVIGRNAVLEALRCGVPATTLYVAARIDMTIARAKSCVSPASTDCICWKPTGSKWTVSHARRTIRAWC